MAGVAARAVSPGPTTTARFLATRPTDPQMRDPSVPFERYGLPEEIADAVAFLCSDAARFVFRLRRWPACNICSWRMCHTTALTSLKSESFVTMM